MKHHKSPHSAQKKQCFWQFLLSGSPVRSNFGMNGQDAAVLIGA